MSRPTPEQRARQYVAAIIDTEAGRMVGVAFGEQRIVKRWNPEQAEELEAAGRLMVKLARAMQTGIMPGESL